MNFENEMWCRGCFLFTETQHHLVDCPAIRDKLRGLVKFEELSYNMIFGSTNNHEKFVKSYTLILAAWKDIVGD